MNQKRFKYVYTFESRYREATLNSNMVEPTWAVY